MAGIARKLRKISAQRADAPGRSVFDMKRI
jgi:hypothetical protein